MRGRALAALGRAAEAEAAFDESAAVARRHGLRLLELLALRDLQRCVLQVCQQPVSVSLTAAGRSPVYSVMAIPPCRGAGAAARACGGCARQRARWWRPRRVFRNCSAPT